MPDTALMLCKDGHGAPLMVEAHVMEKSGLNGDGLCFLTTHLFKVETHHVPVLCIKSNSVFLKTIFLKWFF